MKKGLVVLIALVLAVGLAFLVADRQESARREKELAQQAAEQTTALVPAVAPAKPDSKPVTYPREISGLVAVVDSAGQPVDASHGNVRMMFASAGSPTVEHIARVTDSRWTLRVEHAGTLTPTQIGLILSYEPRVAVRAMCDPIEIPTSVDEAPTLRGVAIPAGSR